MKMSPEKTNESQIIKEGWNRAKTWVYKEGERYKLPNVFENFYMNHIASFKDALDIGCGEARFLIPMLQDGLNVTGTDIADDRLKRAEANIKLAKKSLFGQAQFLVGESKKLDFPNESFDLVFSKGAIHHNMWADIQKSFSEVSRVLKPGKFFIFQGRSTKDSAVSRAELVPDFGITAKDREGWKKGMIQHYFTKEELEQLAKENGFEIVVGPEEILREKNNSGKINARFWVVYRKIL